MSNIGIYKITSPTNKVYIGQSWDVNKRQGHYRRLQCKKQRKLYGSLAKYGWEAHKFEVLMNVSGNIPQEMFDQIEQAYINYYRNNGYELLNLREAGNKGKASEETRRLLSEVQKNLSPEKKANINRSKIGRKFSDAGRLRMSRKSGPENHSFNRPTKESKPIIQLTKNGEFVRDWPFIGAAARELGIDHANISNTCYGRATSAGGYKWKFKLENN